MTDDYSMVYSAAASRPRSADGPSLAIPQPVMPSMQPSIHQPYRQLVQKICAHETVESRIIEEGFGTDVD